VTETTVEEKITRLNALRGIGKRQGVIQIVPPRGEFYFRHVRDNEDQDDHEVVTRPLSSPTGPEAAEGFRNRNGSQIATPQITNVYLGDFWDDRNFVEGFSQALIEHGYLDPLNELGYGTGPGSYLGSIDGPVLHPGTIFRDADAQGTIASLIDDGTVQANENSLIMLILPDGVTSVMDQQGSQSCLRFCGYHEAFEKDGISIAYAVLPSTLCQPCGGLITDFTAVYAHEVAEAVTDKIPGHGWVADDGQENGDLEAWILFGWGPTGDPNRYVVQGYYTNERGNTIGAWR